MYKIASEDFFQLPDFLIEKIEKRIGPNLEIELGTGLLSITNQEMLEILDFEINSTSRTKIELDYSEDTSWSWKVEDSGKSISKNIWNTFKFFTLN